MNQRVLVLADSLVLTNGLATTQEEIPLKSPTLTQPSSKNVYINAQKAPYARILWFATGDVGGFGYSSVIAWQQNNNELWIPDEIDKFDVEFGSVPGVVNRVPSNAMIMSNRVQSTKSGAIEIGEPSGQVVGALVRTYGAPLIEVADAVGLNITNMNHMLSWVF